MSDGKPTDRDGVVKDVHRFRQELPKILDAWRNNLTGRGGLHLWVDIWGEAAEASAYGTAKIVAVLLGLSLAGNLATAVYFAVRALRHAFGA